MFDKKGMNDNIVPARHYEAYEVRMDKGMLCSGILKGKMHSAYNSTVNFAFPLEAGDTLLLTVYRHGTYGIPDSLAVDGVALDALTRLKLGTPAELGEGWLKTPDISIDYRKAKRYSSSFKKLENVTGSSSNLSGVTESRVNFSDMTSSFELPRTEGKISGFELMDSNRRSSLLLLLKAFAREAINTDEEEMQACLMKGIGAGIGLTPSFDDAVVGIAAVFTCAGCYGIETFFHRPGREKSVRLAEFLRGRTSDVSMKYLGCAWRGQFTELLLSLCEALFVGRTPWQEVERIAAVGASSGLDTLTGVEVALGALESRFKSQTT